MTTQMGNMGETPHHKIRLLIKHPCADPTEISSSLGLSPDLAQKSGSRDSLQ